MAYNLPLNYFVSVLRPNDETKSFKIASMLIVSKERGWDGISPFLTNTLISCVLGKEAYGNSQGRSN